jgi:putative transposase
MPGPQPLALMVSNRQQAILHGLVRRQTSPQRLVYRAKAILAATAGNSNAHIAQQLGLNRHTVRTWRRRWRSAVEELAEAEAAGAEDKVLRARIEAVLDDAPRPGTPETFSAEQLTQIISVACEAPEASGRPVTHWTPRELAQEVMQCGIVERISVRTVGRFLKSSRS